MLDRHYDGATGNDLGFWWESQVDAGGEGDDWRKRWGRGVFVVAEGTDVENSVELLEGCDGGVFEVKFGLLDALG